MNIATEPKLADIESLVAEVADRFTEEVKQGRSPSVEEYAERHPEIAHIIRQVFPTLALLDDFSTTGLPPQNGDAQVVGVLGDFRILRELGRGGMGVVYEAEQISLGRRVALKVLPFAAMLDKQQLNRFKNEARAAATLDHPNIVAIYSVGCERGVHYYAMHLVEGQSLAQIVEEIRKSECGLRNEKDEFEISSNSAFRTPHSALDTVAAALSTLPDFSTREYYRSIARLGIQAAEALDHAHQNGILHRDVKPANLLVDDTGKLWITDFGLARMEQDAGMTMSGDLLGTLRYMSPEQALAKRVVVDHRSDIYSLGVTLHELLTLRPAFAGDDRQELLRQIAFEEPRKPRQINGHIPQDLETIVLKAIEKNPADRYATSQELADDLQRFQNARPIAAKPQSRITFLRKWVYRHQALVVSASLAVAAVLLVLLVALVWTNSIIRRERDEKTAALQSKQKAWGTTQEEYRALAILLGSVSDELGNRPEIHSQLKWLRDSVEQQMNVAIELAPEEWEPWYSRGIVYVQIGENEKALHDFSQAIAIDASRHLGWECRAIAHRRMGHFEQAIEDCNTALSIHSGSAESYCCRGECYAHLKQFDNAIRDFDAAIKFYPDYSRVWRMRGMVNHFANNHDAAITDFTKALTYEFPPTDRKLMHNWRGASYFASNRINDGIADYEKAIELDPDDWGILNNFVYDLVTRPNVDPLQRARAVELATKACELSEYKEATPLSSLAGACADRGDFESAIRWAQKACELETDAKNLEGLVQDLDNYKKGKSPRGTQRQKQ